MKKFFTITIIIFLLVISEAVTGDEEGSLVVIPLEKVDGKEFNTLKSYFFDLFSKDALILRYFGDQSLFSAPASKEELKNGCLDAKISNIYCWEKGLLYELTCDCSRYFVIQDYLEVNSEFGSPVILVYEGKNNKLQRINWCPSSSGNFYVTKKDKALKAYKEFLKHYKVNLRSWLKEKIASLFVTLVCHCSADLPKEIILFKGYPGLKDNQIMLLAKFEGYQIKYLFAFDTHNNIQEVIASYQ